MRREKSEDLRYYGLSLLPTTDEAAVALTTEDEILKLFARRSRACTPRATTT